jgi:hypothetical protein
VETRSEGTELNCFAAEMPMEIVKSLLAKKENAAGQKILTGRILTLLLARKSLCDDLIQHWQPRITNGWPTSFSLPCGA